MLSSAVPQSPPQQALALHAVQPAPSPRPPAGQLLQLDRVQLLRYHNFEILRQRQALSLAMDAPCGDVQVSMSVSADVHIRPADVFGIIAHCYKSAYVRLINVW